MNRRTTITIIAWMRLVRWQNLVIIALTQLLSWWCLVLPLAPEVLTPLSFCLLNISTVLIAAAGYIINDYFDIKIDQLNRPNKVILGKRIVGRNAIIAHIVLNTMALILAGLVAVWGRHYEWLLLQIGCIVLLWFYSTTYKRQYMTGNLSIALLTALTIAALYVYEPVVHKAGLLAMLPADMAALHSSLPVWILGTYAFFAFMLTWIREIVKDMEDLKGDETEGCVTMPVKRGLQYASRFASALSVITMLPLLVAAFALYHYHYLLLAGYVLALLVLPLILWMRYLWRGVASPAHYHRCSQGIKLIMLLGVLSLIVYKFQ